MDAGGQGERCESEGCRGVDSAQDAGAGDAQGLVTFVSDGEESEGRRLIFYERVCAFSEDNEMSVDK